MGESKKMWAEKRRASAIFRSSQAIPSSNKNKTTEVTTPTEKGKAATSRKKDTESKEAENNAGQPVKNRTLRDIVLGASYNANGHRELPSWETLPEVTAIGLPESLEEKTLNAAKITFRLAASEAEYNEELSNLCQLGKRIVVQWTNDPSPTFLRRAVFSHIQRMKSQSDALLAKMESLWEKRPTLTGVHGFYAQAIPEMKTPYVSYSGHIEEIRLIIQRALEVHPDALWAASTGNGKRELSLAPIQRLTSLRIMLQASTANDTPLKYEEKGDAKKAIQGIKELLDECYAEMTSQSGTEYVAEIDNLLDFGELATGKSPLLLLLAACGAGGDSSDEEEGGGSEGQLEGRKRIECLASRPSIFWNPSASITE
ncbi:rho guanine nucleotide exchange factor 15-like [Hetaerina americana]|uniref:rho guanine nucleotide exchange factor 15-like n=1 Tax=Hetaerina americana TaxID=62018 RepID=UPI003A7F3025